MRLGEISNGSVTPEAQGEYLKKHAHLIGVVGEEHNYVHSVSKYIMRTIT